MSDAPTGHDPARVGRAVNARWTSRRHGRDAGAVASQLTRFAWGVGRSAATRRMLGEYVPIVDAAGLPLRPPAAAWRMARAPEEHRVDSHLPPDLAALRRVMRIREARRAPSVDLPARGLPMASALGISSPAGPRTGPLAAGIRYRPRPAAVNRLPEVAAASPVANPIAPMSGRAAPAPRPATHRPSAPLAPAAAASEAAVGAGESGRDVIAERLGIDPARMAALRRGLAAQEGDSGGTGGSTGGSGGATGGAGGGPAPAVPPAEPGATPERDGRRGDGGPTPRASATPTPTPTPTTGDDEGGGGPTAEASTTPEARLEAAIAAAWPTAAASELSAGGIALAAATPLARRHTGSHRAAAIRHGRTGALTPAPAMAGVGAFDLPVRGWAGPTTAAAAGLADRFPPTAAPASSGGARPASPGATGSPAWPFWPAPPVALRPPTARRAEPPMTWPGGDPSEALRPRRPSAGAVTPPSPAAPATPAPPAPGAAGGTGTAAGPATADVARTPGTTTAGTTPADVARTPGTTTAGATPADVARAPGTTTGASATAPAPPSAAGGPHGSPDLAPSSWSTDPNDPAAGPASAWAPEALATGGPGSWSHLTDPGATARRTPLALAGTGPHGAAVGDPRAVDGATALAEASRAAVDRAWPHWPLPAAAVRAHLPAAAGAEPTGGAVLRRLPAGQPIAAPPAGQPATAGATAASAPGAAAGATRTSTTATGSATPGATAGTTQSTTPVTTAGTTGATSPGSGSAASAGGPPTPGTGAWRLPAEGPAWPYWPAPQRAPRLARGEGLRHRHHPLARMVDAGASPPAVPDLGDAPVGAAGALASGALAAGALAAASGAGAGAAGPAGPTGSGVDAPRRPATAATGATAASLPGEAAGRASTPVSAAPAPPTTHAEAAARFTATLARLRPDPIVDLPAPFVALAKAIVGDRRVKVSAGTTSAAALAAAGHEAASVGMVIHVPRALAPTAADYAVVAHELTHVAAAPNRTAPRFLADHQHDSEEKQAEDSGWGVGALLSRLAEAAGGALGGLFGDDAKAGDAGAAGAPVAPAAAVGSAAAGVGSAAAAAAGGPGASGARPSVGSAAGSAAASTGGAPRAPGTAGLPVGGAAGLRQALGGATGAGAAPPPGMPADEDKSPSTGAASATSSPAAAAPTGMDPMRWPAVGAPQGGMAGGSPGGGDPTVAGPSTARLAAELGYPGSVPGPLVNTTVSSAPLLEEAEIRRLVALIERRVLTELDRRGGRGAGPGGPW